MKFTQNISAPENWLKKVAPEKNCRKNDLNNFYSEKIEQKNWSKKSSCVSPHPDDPGGVVYYQPR